MGKRVSMLSVCICLALAVAASGESAPAAVASSSTNIIATSTGTVRVATPSATVRLTVSGSHVVITSDKPVVLPSGTHFYAWATYSKVDEKDGKKETRGLSAPNFSIKVAEGEVTTLNVGPPLVAKVTVGKVYVSSAAGDRPEVRSIRIDLALTGQAGEVYRSITKSGAGEALASGPSFTILDDKGAEIGQGNCEYG
jgi:hypothetical protein